MTTTFTFFKTQSVTTMLNRLIVNTLFVTAGLLLSGKIQAATVAIASAPLVSATTSQVLPNLMYILDNSGSMASDYMPDYVNDINKCKSTNPAGDFSANCQFGDPPYNSNFYNSIYYNPAIRYSPAVDYTGIERTSMTSANTTAWTIVPVDAYGIYSTSNKSLVPVVGDSTKGYPDRVWCNTNAASVADLIDPTKCKKNGPQYIYPNNTGTSATSFNNAYTLNGNPYYYTVSPGEYCSDKQLTTCVPSTVPTGANIYPATLRWCNSSARTNCQAKYLDSTGYTFAKWSGINPGSQSSGQIRINADTIGCGAAGQPSCSAPSAINITDITVNGVSIITSPIPSNLTITDTTNSGQRSALATNIRDAINNFVPSSGDDFSATSSGDTVTISRVGFGPFLGTILLSATTVNRPAASGTKAVGSISFSRARNSGTMNSISVNSNGGSGPLVQIMNTTVTATSSGSDNTPDLATKVKNAINTLTATSGYSASCTGGATCTSGTVTITAVNNGAAGNGTISTSLGGSSVGSGNIRYTTSSLAGGSVGASSKNYTLADPDTLTYTQFNGGTPVVNTFSRVDIEPSTTSYTKASSRTDCVGSSCTYVEEMTNFANWFAYYNTRMEMMKTSTSRAFTTIDTRYRVGFITINNMSTYYLPVAQFDATQKSNWYAKLFSVGGNSSTPLRTAISTVGRIFAGKKPVGTSDPMQYSCQQNFALLTTDGYWNGGGGLQVDGTTSIGNLDGGATGRPMFEGSTASSDTLADAAKYYYDNDLRDSSQGNCTGALGTDVCQNNVFVSTTDTNEKQHMTTFTLGLGVDGELRYTSDYRSATSGDYYDIKQGTKDWPVPVADTQSAVDDLWHAAVNGQGTYFSARDPNQLNKSLAEALQSIGAKIGAGAAAATSTLSPVAGDNYAYVGSYATVSWTGNLEARTINLATGAVSEDAAWCVENVAATSCSPPSSVVSEDVNGSTVAYCVTPSATAATCILPNILDGTNCKQQVATACTGAMTDNVGPSLSNRNILIKDGATNNLVNFTYANLSATQKPYFENTWLTSNLSQWSALNPDQLAAASAANGVSLVNYLRGETGYEDRASNGPISPATSPDKRLYRFRQATMGDALDSTPIFVGNENGVDYEDPNFGSVGVTGTFKDAQKNRVGTVYIGTNDGMLHAFDASTDANGNPTATSGEERWAYIPSMVIPNLYKLADKNYATQHANFVNGDAIRGSICYSNCSVSGAGGAAWKTILVGSLNGGGRGYYALDVTNPVTPTLLWEFTPAEDDDLGLSFGNPQITKKADGTWVVLLTSGYNNTTGSIAANRGKGFLYVLNANTGAVISKYNTGVGDPTTPSGLAKISAYVNNPRVNNTVTYVYGGDLLGNVWRFDINSVASATNPFKFAVLKDNQSTPQPQPITVRPTLTEVSGKRLIVIGTGKYLEIPDLTNTQKQSVYAISDDSSVTTTLDNPRASGSIMVNQTLVNGGATRSVSAPTTVNYATQRGWYIDFPDSGERQNIPSQFVNNSTLLLPTIVPSNTVCSPGGYGWLNFLDIKTGSSLSATNVVGYKINSPIVGLNVLYINGSPVVNLTTSDNPTPQLSGQIPSSSGSNFNDHRMIWRELPEDE